MGNAGRMPIRTMTKKTHSVVAIGNFDGAHLGHGAVALAARRCAQDQDAVTTALTFEPHPRRFFQPNVPHFRLTPEDEREERLKAIGFEHVVVLPFDAQLSGMGAEAFITDILLGQLHAKGVVVGEDFHFGKNRQGTPDFLMESGKKHGFAVALVPPLRGEDGTIISSSAIRAALSAGDVPRANRMLGAPYSVRGVVIHGEKRGRDLGFRTANLKLDVENGLKFGIYAVRVLVEGAMLTGVASFGRRPTFDDGAPLLEVHLFDFSGDLYGKSMEVRFEAFLRPELKFDGIPALIEQMELDCSAARALL